jgi:hypothetical protein
MKRTYLLAVERSSVSQVAETLTEVLGARFATKSLEGRADWAAHATFIDAYSTSDSSRSWDCWRARGGRSSLGASSTAEIMELLALDPWTASGLLITRQISPWQLRLGSLP